VAVAVSARPDGRLASVSIDRALRPIAAAYRATVAQVAIAWLLKKPGVSPVALGASKLRSWRTTWVRSKLT
jgi:aryl-alcohol dehydrogenase-like predicted oxidoreductase